VYLINTDKPYKVEMRGYERQGDVVVYNFVLIDLVYGFTYSNPCRYQELKCLNSALQELEVTLIIS